MPKASTVSCKHPSNSTFNPSNIPHSTPLLRAFPPDPCCRRLARFQLKATQKPSVRASTMVVHLLKPYTGLFALLCVLVVAQGSSINLPSDAIYGSMRGLLDDSMGLQPQAANLAYPAYSSYGYGPKPAPGPSKCSGVITAIWCKESADGVLTDIAYLNSETGLQLPGCSASDWTTDFSKALYLAEGESIIKVSTCKGKAPKRMFEAVTFITDAGQKLVCGKKGDSYADDYSSYGHEYPTEPYSADQPSTGPVEATLKSIQATLQGDDRSPARGPAKEGNAGKKDTPKREDEPVNDNDDQAQDDGDSERQEDDNSSFGPDQDEPGQDEYDPERSGRNHRAKKVRGYNKARQYRRRNGQYKRESKYSEDSHGDDHNGYQGDKYVRKERPDASKNYQEDASSGEYVAYTRRAAKAALKQARKDARRYSTSYKGSDEGSYGYKSHGRQLRQTGEQEEAELAGVDRDYRGYNSRSYYPHYPHNSHHSHGPIDPAKRWYYDQPRCSITESPEKPIWSSVPDWYLMTAGPDPALGFSGSGLDAYFVYDDKHYYKNRNAYIKESNDAQPGSLSYTPAYYYDEVDPLATFNVYCSRDKCVTSMHNFCWNNHYNSTKPDGVPGVISPGLDPAPPGTGSACPTTPAELQQFDQDTKTISNKLNEASGGIIDSIAWERYTPSLCSQDFGENATVTLGAIFVPGEGHTQAEVRDWLESNAVTNEGEPDLCEVQIDSLSICTDTTFYTLPYALASVSGRRSLLSVALPTGGSTFPRAGQIMSAGAEDNARRGVFDMRSGGVAGGLVNGPF